VVRAVNVGMGGGSCLESSGHLSFGPWIFWPIDLLAQ